jgi:hypothetical protein
MNVKKSNFKKRASVIVAVMCILSLLMSGTYAFVSRSQHKTNEGSGTFPKHDVKLIEDYNEVDDWKTPDGEVKKEIRVTNRGLASEGYGSIYVRLQLKEYMEIGDLVYTHTDERYMVSTNGNYVRFDTQQEALDAYPGHVVTELTDAVTGIHGWFIQTQAHDPNGQYGDYVITNIEVGNAVSLVPGVVKAAHDASDNHQAANNGECLYTVHKWNGTEPEDDGMTFHDYIRWILGSDIITLSDWIAGGAQPIDKWILDDRDIDNPFAYWGQALEPQNDARNNPNSTTSNLMDAIELILQPEGSFYYAIHVDMEAVSIHELAGNNPEWTDAPEEIIDSIIANTPSIIFGSLGNTTITVNQTLPAPTVTVFPTGTSQTVTWTTGNSTIATVDHETGLVTGVAPGKVQIIATGANGQKNSYTVTVIPAELTLDERLDKAIADANEVLGHDNSGYTDDSIQDLTDARDAGVNVKNNGNATDEQKEQAINDIYDNINLTPKTPTGGPLDVNTPAGGFSPTPVPGDPVNDGRPLIGGENFYLDPSNSTIALERVGWIPLSEVIKNFDPSKPVTISFAGGNAKYQGKVTIGDIPSGNKAGQKAILLSYLPSFDEVGATFPTLPSVTLQANLTQDGKTTQNPITININYRGLIN